MIKTTIEGKGIVIYKGEETAIPGLIEGEKIKIKISSRGKVEAIEEIIAMEDPWHYRNKNLATY